MAAALLLGAIAPILAATDVTRPIALLDHPAIAVAGLVVTLAGFAGVLVAQQAMGASWRVGVDPNERTDLVTSGIFSIVRNPIFTAMITATIGLTAMVPIWPQLLALTTTITGIHIQVRAVEEPYLTRTHGTTYTTYTHEAGRFLPRINIRVPLGATLHRTSVCLRSWFPIGKAVMVVVLLTLICGCGTQPAGDMGGSASSVYPESSSAMSPTAPVTSLGGGPSSSDNVSVSVGVDAARYQSGAAITAKVVNNGRRAIFTEDQKTECSILTLQRQQGAGWVPLVVCNAERAPQTVVIGPANHHSVTIHLTGELAAGRGNYRLALGFRLDREPQGAESEHVTSPMFSIG